MAEPQSTILDLSQSHTEILDIGTPAGLDLNADLLYRTTSKAKLYMNKIDLIPVSWSINYPSISLERREDASYGAIVLNYTPAIQEYQKRERQLGLEQYQGLRIWTTATTQYQENYVNNYEENSIEKSINTLTGNFNEVRDLLRSIGYNPDNLSSMVPGPDSPALDLVKNTLISGKQMALPKIWRGSTYEPVLNVQLKLVSPYGNPKSIKYWVLRPLLHLLAICSPTTSDGMTYGNVGYVHVQAYGQSNMNVGFVTNLTVTRAGPDITYNKFQQPLSLDITMAITPAVNGFAILENDQMSNKILTINDMDGGTHDNSLIIDNLDEFAMTTTNDIIKSFMIMPGTDDRFAMQQASDRDKITFMQNSTGGLLSGSMTSIANGVGNALSGAASGLSNAISGLFA